MIHVHFLTQITADPRVRLERQLREAGLHDRPYARQALAEVAPVHPQRRDMESSIFK